MKNKNEKIKLVLNSMKVTKVLREKKCNDIKNIIKLCKNKKHKQK